VQDALKATRVLLEAMMLGDIRHRCSDSMLAGLVRARPRLNAQMEHLSDFFCVVAAAHRF
jgi:hypothetical protein